MSSLEHIDLLLGEAIEHIIDASDEMKEIEILNYRENSKRIGRAVSEIWEIREKIYQLDPNIKRDFFIEYNDDRKRFETLNEIFKKAYSLEKNGKLDESIILYNELHKISHFGYFRLLSEAGLYRVSMLKYNL